MLKIHLIIFVFFIFNGICSQNLKLNINKKDISGTIYFNPYGTYNITTNQLGHGIAIGKYGLRDNIQLQFSYIFFKAYEESDYHELYSSIGLNYRFLVSKKIQFWFLTSFQKSTWFNNVNQELTGFDLGLKINYNKLNKSKLGISLNNNFSFLYNELMISFGLEYRFKGKIYPLTSTNRKRIKKYRLYKGTCPSFN